MIEESNFQTRFGKELIMKKKISFEAVMTGSFLAFLGLFTAISVLMPRKAFSETENRYLARFPKLTWETVKSGAFGTDYETYLSDHFPFRDSWIGFQAAAEKRNKRRVPWKGRLSHRGFVPGGSGPGKL